MNSGRMSSLLCILIAYMIVSGSIQEISCTCIGSNKGHTCDPYDRWYDPYVDAGGLPGEIHLSMDTHGEMFADDAKKCWSDNLDRSSCINLRSYLTVFSSAYNHKIYDLKWALRDVYGNEHLLGLAWRVRGSNGNALNCLPGYFQSENGYNVYRYLITEKDHISSALSDGYYTFYGLLKASCYAKDDNNRCTAICDGKYSSGSLGISWGYIYPPSDNKIEWEMKTAKINGANLMFQFTTKNGDHAPGNKYHMFLYDNTGTGKPIRETFAYSNIATRNGGIGGIYVETFRFNLKKNCQYNLLSKATTRFDDTNCNDAKSFLGDIYPNWKSNIQHNLGIALTRCDGATKKKCTEWTLYKGVTIEN